MSVSSASDRIKITIDGVESKVPPGINLIEAAALAAKEIPHYCYHPKLSIVGNCRMCLIEIGLPAKDRATGEPILDVDGQPRIDWVPKPVIGCGTKTTPGMHIKTQSTLIDDCRNGVMEFLLLNHPLDCPICDQAGECRLQEFATDYGRGYSRFTEEKNSKPKRTRLGPRVMLDDERCILCSRCIRFCQEVVNDDVLGFVDRGSYTTLTCFPGKELANNYSLNTVDICPVGALTSTDFRFKMRVWFLKETRSICTESSMGVNTWVGSREGKIYRITPRRNDAVNETWMPDSGRMLYRQVEDEGRITEYRIDGIRVSSEKALERAAELLSAEAPVAYVGNGYSTVEEQFILQQLVASRPGSVYFVAHHQKGDDFLISNDSTPNVRGALAVGLIKCLPKLDLKDLAAQINAGEVHTLLVHNQTLENLGLTSEQLAQVDIIYLGTHENRTAQNAKVVLPSLMVFEKDGTFINRDFRLQSFESAVPGPEGVLSDLNTLSCLNAYVRGERFTPLSLNSLWVSLAETVDLFSGMSFDAIPDEGQVIDGSPFSSLPFCE